MAAEAQHKTKKIKRVYRTQHVASVTSITLVKPNLNYSSFKATSLRMAAAAFTGSSKDLVATGASIA